MTKEEALERLETARLAKIESDGGAYGVIIGPDISDAIDGASVPNAETTWVDRLADSELIDWMTEDETDDANGYWWDAKGA